MKPLEFVKKWGDSLLRERQGSQEHFIDLCHVLGEPTPAEDDPRGERYCFERGAEKTGGGDGWADVWRRGCFGWEYKGKHKDLDAALRQLAIYVLDLENPPYLVVSDMERIIVHTNWTNTVSRRIEFNLNDLLEPAKLDLLRQVFRGSESLKPGQSPQELTAKVAARFGELGRRLQERDHHPRVVAHFLNRLVFCMFAEDAGLLPNELFHRVVRGTELRPDIANTQISELFSKMATGGFFGADRIKHFNGGLFDDAAVLPLEPEDLKLIADTAAEHDWSQIDPSIFGNLFEAALTATQERQLLGAHYTDRATILKIVEPVVVRPLAAEWEQAFAQITAAMKDARAADEERRGVLASAAALLLADRDAARQSEAGRRKTMTAIARKRTAAVARAAAHLETFLTRLAAFRVLDPACGSGNFLYVALHAIKDLELKALVDTERLGLPAPLPRVGLEVVLGIEKEAYAAELARVTLWIGDLQWMRRHGYTGYAEPILSTLDQIENRDAVLDGAGAEASWPAVDAIIGNPPFVGGKKMRDSLGDDYVERLFTTYQGRVPAEADFVCYWVVKAWDAIRAGRTERAGLVTTNSIRGGANRRVLDPIADADAIWEAWADEPWALKGAAVRVSMIGIGRGFVERRLEGRPTPRINADLTGAAADLTKAVRLLENAGVAFMGDTKGGAFDVSGDQAREWLRLPLNPNGRPNSDVLKPWRNAMDVTRRSADKWIVDFGWTMSEAGAALYEEPFRHVLTRVKPERDANARETYRLNWWRHVEPRQGMWGKIGPLFIATPTVARHRLFVWLRAPTCPDHQLIVVTRDDAATFGVLHSRFHELWALRLGTWLGVGNDPRYTPSTTFETFPFPEGLTPDIAAADYTADPRAIAIAGAAQTLNERREAWLNPDDLVIREPEVVPGYPDRVLPKDEDAERELKKRTLTNLYNARPAWLDMAHRALDAAVATAYGWPDNLTDDQVLERLFILNQERAAAGR